MKNFVQTIQWAKLGWLFVCLILLLAPQHVDAGQEVRVLMEADEEGNLESRAVALDQALRLGVFQEAEVLLRGGPGETRSALLREVLAARASDYVLGYAELEHEITAWGAVLHVDVRVNRQALRTFLQSLGVYYTVGRFVGYALEGENLTSDEQALVQDMETLSGLHRGETDSPALRLGRTAEGGWQGILDFEGMVWSAQSQDLPQLWASLWGNYFSLERVRQGFENKFLLATRGWSGTVDVMGFDQVLRGWDLQVGAVNMVGMSLGPLGFQAQWEITTMDRPGLEQRLGRVLGGKRIEYSFSSK